ncbi:MAG: DUF1844 domain-containing protein [Candidatus Eisenbacteria bacterium]|nr:DUF1844 domain-containing protein [Candidatus Eisenbacteria bacterium]
MSEELERAFVTLVAQLDYGARIGLGLRENPATKERKVDAEHARMFIDQLEALQERTRGNLAENEARVLQDSLYELRMSYVHIVGGKNP